MIKTIKRFTMDICYPVTIQTGFVNQQQEHHTQKYGLMKNFASYFDYKNSLEE